MVGQNYQLKARLSRMIPGVPQREYWEDYEKTHKNVATQAYTSECPPVNGVCLQELYFYGYFKPKEGWTFFVKGTRNGKITNIQMARK